MESVSEINISDILDSMSDGIYVCKPDRTIVFWSRSAERITGWRPEEVLGRRCKDGILAHKDKDGHSLCGEAFCPLHRAMVTGEKSERPVIIYAKSSDGQRIPMEVLVAPIKNEQGEVIGGVETFRDVSALINNLETARKIQRISLKGMRSEDARFTFTPCYIPNEIVGGDYYAINRIDEDRYGVMLADVMGHGISAALYTMYLSLLWDNYSDLIVEPAEFANRMNLELRKILKGSGHFAAAVCGVFDLKNREIHYAGAGSEPMLLIKPDGSYEVLECVGLPLGLMDNVTYNKNSRKLAKDDRILLFSDAATEVINSKEEVLETEGFAEIIAELTEPGSPLPMSLVEKKLLEYSNAIRLTDDLTILEFYFHDL